MTLLLIRCLSAGVWAGAVQSGTEAYVFELYRDGPYSGRYKMVGMKVGLL